MTQRWIVVEGLVNVRDLGGLPTRDGRHVRTGRLLRGDSVHDLPAASVEHLVDVLGVRDVVDLRTGVERDLVGEGPLDADDRVRVHRHSLVRDSVARGHAAEAALAIPWDNKTVVRDAAFWARHYGSYLRGRPDSVSSALRVLASGSGATFVHCAAGKDRTGTVVAMALDVAEVPHEEIVTDYALSAERIEAIIERLMTFPGYAATLAGRSVADEAPRPEAMSAFLTALADEHGGTLGWLRAHGWSAADIDDLRRRLTA